jgi:hypothetical protein
VSDSTLAGLEYEEAIRLLEEQRKKIVRLKLAGKPIRKEKATLKMIEDAVAQFGARLKRKNN